MGHLVQNWVSLMRFLPNLHEDFMRGSVDAAIEVDELRRKAETLSKFPDDLDWDLLQLGSSDYRPLAPKLPKCWLPAKLEMFGEDHPETLSMKYFCDFF